MRKIEWGEYVATWIGPSRKGDEGREQVGADFAYRHAVEIEIGHRDLPSVALKVALFPEPAINCKSANSASPLVGKYYVILLTEI